MTSVVYEDVHAQVMLGPRAIRAWNRQWLCGLPTILFRGTIRLATSDGVRVSFPTAGGHDRNSHRGRRRKTVRRRHQRAPPRPLSCGRGGDRHDGNSPRAARPGHVVGVLFCGVHAMYLLCGHDYDGWRRRAAVGDCRGLFRLETVGWGWGVGVRRAPYFLGA